MSSLLASPINLSHISPCNTLFYAPRAETVRCTPLFYPLECSNTPTRIIRIIFMIPVFATISFLCIHFEEASAYISPVNELYEAFAFAAFFQLLYTYVLEETHARSFSEQASQLPPIRKTAVQIFQFPAIMFIVFLIEEISEAKGTYCETEIKIYFTRIWVRHSLVFLESS